jgi:predicted transcriptional regulator
MDTQDLTFELLQFFKALADENRLKIIGLLAQRPHTVESLAETLNLSASTTSHHLSRLAKTGLVSARTDGHYYYYSLHTDKLRGMAQQLLQEEHLPRLADVQGEDVFERKTLASFTDSNGRITAFPAQENKLLVILRYVLKAFEPGIRYTEKQINEILSKYNTDTAFLRRSLVEYRMMQREGGGKEYWRDQE